MQDYSVVESRYKQEVPGFMKAVTREQRSSYEPRPNVNVILRFVFGKRMQQLRTLYLHDSLDRLPRTIACMIGLGC